MTDDLAKPASRPSAPAKAVLLPRLSIHAFCEDQETADLIGAAASDRRLAKTHLTVQMGGIHLACSFYDKAPTPNLIIVESLLDAASMLADLEKLAEVCEPETRVLVVGHINDVLLYRELMRREVSDYLVPPFTAEEIAGSIVGVFASEPVPAPGRVIAFIGAKGGAGSSTMCQNVGWTLAETLASDTIIADLDLAFGTVGLNFNQELVQGTREAIASDRLDEAMVERLKALLEEHPGDSPVFLHVGSKVLRLPAAHSVDPGRGLLGELKVLLGANAIVGSMAA